MDEYNTFYGEDDLEETNIKEGGETLVSDGALRAEEGLCG